MILEKILEIDPNNRSQHMYIYIYTHPKTFLPVSTCYIFLQSCEARSVSEAGEARSQTYALFTTTVRRSEGKARAVPRSPAVYAFKQFIE